MLNILEMFFYPFYAYQKKAGGLKAYRSNLSNGTLIKAISLAGKKKPLKFQHKRNTSIATFLLILASLLGRKIKKALGIAFLDTAKSKRRKPARAAPPGGRRPSSHTKRIMHEATTVSSRREIDEEQRQAAVAEGEGEDRRWWPGEL